MTKKGYKILIICAVVLLLGCMCAIGFILFSSSLSSYDKHVRTAQGYLKSNDYNNAVLEFKEAIEADPENEDAYLGIAKAYHDMNNFDDACRYLEEGIRKTNSSKLENLLKQYLIEKDSRNEGEPVIEYSLNQVFEKSADVIIRSGMFSMLSSFTYDQYVESYGEPISESDTAIEYENVPIVFNYTQAPVGTDMPNNVSFTKIDFLFENFVSGVSYERLQALGLEGLNHEFSSIYNKNVVSFDGDRCHYVIECDEDGNIVSSAPWNIVIITGSDQQNAQPEPETEPEEEIAPEVGKSVLKGTAFNTAPGGENVAVNINIYSGDKALDSALVISDKTTSKGKYRFELEPGNYFIQALIDDEVVFETEYEIRKEDTVYKLDMPYNKGRELREGEIRVVLYWDDPNANLDHTLEGYNSEGYYVYCCHSPYDSGNHMHYSGDELVISSGPEVDGGPEEITVFDIGGNYQYSVTSSLGDPIAGARVEVYTAGSEKPVVFTCPEDYDSMVWNVFVYENGDVRAI